MFTSATTPFEAPALALLKPPTAADFTALLLELELLGAEKPVELDAAKALEELAEPKPMVVTPALLLLLLPAPPLDI